jgi:[protein-PII] uridylyltransferase
MPAVVAIGGYGRGELNPRSDIDIMFLCRDETDRRRAPDMLYALWDAGLDIGYSVRTVPECVELGRQDIKIRTSLLESRLIAGEEPLYDSFLKAMHSEVFYWKASSFIAEKIGERHAVRQKFGGSLYLREPNIKESAGGLRDFHTALWIAFVHFKVTSLAQLASQGVITEGQYSVFLRSRNFLWRLRNEVHYLSGRKNDQLTFDLQEQAAKDFNYRDSAHLLAVERFMKAYFIHAKNIREFSGIVMDAALRKPERRRWFERSVPIGPFVLMGKTLIPPADDLFRKEPALIPAAFEVMHSRGAVFSNRLKALIREQRFGNDVRTSPAASSAFLAVLGRMDGLAGTLSLMKDLRFLGRYIPEFRPVQSLAKHDYYHKYTVDEHILTAVRNLEDLWLGRYPARATLSQALKTLKKRWLLTLSVLLHDLGKAFRSDHDIKSAELAEGILARLGVAGEDRERVLFLIRHHLAMSNLSQRRELNDGKVIAGFARLVRDRENLTMLYLLTYADIAAVNPTAWTQWKAALLQDLYIRTLNFLDKKAVAAEEEHARLIAASGKIRAAAEKLFSSEEIDSFLVALPEKYILYTPVPKALDHMGMMKRLPEEKLVIQHRHYPERGYTELTVCAYDAYGMFYRTAGTLAAKNLSILRAQVFTTKSGIMLDSYQVTDAEGNLYDYEEAWKSVKADLRKALTGRGRPPEPGRYPVSKAVSETIPVSVDFDNESSGSFTIIDITARDRVGLLYGIAKALFDLNLDIASAKIVTEGLRAMDSFYVTDLLRNKVLDAERLERIRESLVKVLV